MTHPAIDHPLDPINDVDVLPLQSPRPLHLIASPMSFGEAMEAVTRGEKVGRRGWQNTDAIFLHAAYLHVQNADGLHRLIVSDGDLTATDWFIIVAHA